VVPSHNPPNSSSSVLDGLACARVTSCWAVGYYDSANGTQTLPYAEHWNGRAWSEVAMPYPAHETLVVNLLRAVSCPAARLCFADGGFERESGGIEYSASLIERWNGRSWKIVPSPAVPDSATTDLQGLSCGSARRCWATGDWLSKPGASGTPSRGGALGYHWNGRKWTAVRITRTRYSNAGDLSAASCVASMCMATGAEAEVVAGLPALRPFAQRWGGSSWVAAPVIVEPMPTALQGVSCASSRMCMAVGYMYDGHGTATLVEHWNGSTWATVGSPNPAGALGPDLYGVTCPQVRNCWAVGTSNTSSVPQFVVLIEHWNGKAWSIVAS
jgi:hypothetical protein